MSLHSPARIVGNTRDALIAIVGLGILGAIGYALPNHTMYALAAAGILLAGAATFVQPMALPLLSMVTLVVVARVGGESTNLSLSDFMLFLAFWVAIVLAPRPFSRPMRAILWLSLIYQATALFTVFGNSYSANTIEWFHEWLLVAGALVVGWALGASGRASLALSCILVPCLLLAVLTCYAAITHLAQTGHLQAVYLTWPYGMQKNFTGDVLGLAAAIFYIRPTWLRWPNWLSLASFWICLAGTFGSQARQALIGLGVVIVIAALRPNPDRQHSKLILLPLIAGAAFVGSMLSDQLQSDNTFNSAYQRISWYDDSMTVWHQSPWIGSGLRWWYTGKTGFNFQPPNAELEVLTSVGIIGLAGFLILMVGSLIVTWRIDPRYGTLAFAVLLNRFVVTQVDLFWVSVQVSAPFVIVGIALGAQAFHQRRRSPAVHTSIPVSVS